MPTCLSLVRLPPRLTKRFYTTGIQEAELKFTIRNVNSLTLPLLAMSPQTAVLINSQRSGFPQLSPLALLTLVSMVV